MNFARLSEQKLFFSLEILVSKQASNQAQSHTRSFLNLPSSLFSWYQYNPLLVFETLISKLFSSPQNLHLEFQTLFSFDPPWIPKYPVLFLNARNKILISIREMVTQHQKRSQIHKICNFLLMKFNFCPQRHR